MGDAKSGGPVGDGHGHMKGGEVRVDGPVALVQTATQGNNVRPVPAVAAADLAIVALLQELLATLQAITARLSNIENNQAHPQLQRHRQAQPARQPQQAAFQLAGGSTHSMASATKDAIQQATITAGLTANAKEAADLWRANNGPNHCSSPATASTSQRKQTDDYCRSFSIPWPTSLDAVLKQLKTMSGFAVEDSAPPRGNRRDAEGHGRRD